MKEVTKFESDDGLIFDTEEECNHWESGGKAEEDFKSWYSYTDGLWGEGSLGKVPVNQMLEWLRDNREQVLSLLT